MSFDGPPFDPTRLLEVLTRHEVRFCAVGGFAGVLHGATAPTSDLDCVPASDEANLGRLAGAMRELNARLRVHNVPDQVAKELPVTIDARFFQTSEASTWTTDAGDFDVLVTMADEHQHRHGYDELLKRANTVDHDGHQVVVACLDDVISSKVGANRDKDREKLPELRQLREQQSRDRLVQSDQTNRADGHRAPGPPSGPASRAKPDRT